MLNERELIEQIAAGARGTAPDLVQGIGDDCAVIAGPYESVWLLSTDTLMEKVHFDLAWHPPRLLGRKAVAVNLSDVAAMGGKTRFLLLSLALPANFPQDWREELLAGIIEACREHGCLLVGGDTVHSPCGLALTLTVVGQQPASAVVYRHGAQPGDIVWVSGRLGSAAVGLELCRRGRRDDATLAPLIAAHLDPSPRCSLGQELACRRLAHAMQDISDGIATDLAHICTASGVGARIEASRLPSHPLLAQAVDLLGCSPLELMLRGGEDYELLWTADPASSSAMHTLSETLHLPCHPIGRIISGQGVQLVQRDVTGTEIVHDITYQGYDHFPPGAEAVR